MRVRAPGVSERESANAAARWPPPRSRPRPREFKARGTSLCLGPWMCTLRTGDGIGVTRRWPMRVESSATVATAAFASQAQAKLRQGEWMLDAWIGSMRALAAWLVGELGDAERGFAASAARCGRPVSVPWPHRRAIPDGRAAAVPAARWLARSHACRHLGAPPPPAEIPPGMSTFG